MRQKPVSNKIAPKSFAYMWAGELTKINEIGIYDEGGKFKSK